MINFSKRFEKVYWSVLKNGSYLRLHSYTPDFHGDQTHPPVAPYLLKHCWKKHFNLSWGIHVLNKSRNHILFQKASLKSLKMEMFVINTWKLWISFPGFLHTPFFLVDIFTCCLAGFWEKDIWKNMTYCMLYSCMLRHHSSRSMGKLHISFFFVIVAMIKNSDNSILRRERFTVVHSSREWSIMTEKSR